MGSVCKHLVIGADCYCRITYALYIHIMCRCPARVETRRRRRRRRWRCGSGGGGAEEETRHVHLLRRGRARGTVVVEDAPAECGTGRGTDSHHVRRVGSRTLITGHRLIAPHLDRTCSTRGVYNAYRVTCMIYYVVVPM